MPNLTNNTQLPLNEDLVKIVRHIATETNLNNSLNANSLEYYENDCITICLKNNHNYYLKIDLDSLQSTLNNKSGSVILTPNIPNGNTFAENIFRTYGELKIAIRNSISEIPDQFGGIHNDNGFKMRGGNLKKYLKYKKKYLNLKYGIL
jgi:hypothetical protein